MRVALSARNVPPTQERAIKMNDLARLYWNMGYRQTAERISDQSLQLDSAYFWGLLWGFHFNRLNGDTADVHRYLRQLDAIAGGNQVVVVFHRFLAIDDTLGRTSDGATRSALHLEEGRLYQKIELFEEALDEAERALGADPGNTGARELMAEVFLTKGRELLDDAKGPRMNGPLRLASRYYDEVASAEPANALARAKADTLHQMLSRP
jgi:tetratricopeptide (TPR) repeat protein